MLSSVSWGLDDLLIHLSDSWICSDIDGSIGDRWTAGGQNLKSQARKCIVTIWLDGKDLLGSSDVFLDSYCKAITKLIDALDKPNVKRTAGPGFVKGSEHNRKSFQLVGKEVVEVVGKDCNTDKLAGWVDETGKMLQEGLERVR
ncbi:hypothetical protein LTR17_002998 [Elasticomyces elasticus]|nr:hypothetical protein LTR17_002998 [Elasticomyces elasticus]